MLICPVFTKKNKFTVPVTKHRPFRCHFAPLWPRASKFSHVRFEFGLHMDVKFYLDPLRFAGVIRKNPIFEQIHITLACIRDVIGSLITTTATITTIIIIQVPHSRGASRSYDIFTCAQKRTNSQLSLPHGTEKKQKRVGLTKKTPCCPTT